MPTITGRRQAWLFSYLYCVSYITRINFAAVIQEVITSTGFERSALSAVLVCLSVSYGIGQIVNGRLGDKIKPQDLIFIGLCTAALMNLLFPFCAASIPAMCVLWTVNGFAQAMMWPPMVKIMVASMDDATYASSVIKVSYGSSVGTILVYLTAPVVIRFFSWQVIMIASAVIGAVSAVLWFFLKDRCYAGDTAATVRQNAKFKMPRRSVLPFILIAIGVILMGMIRDGVTSWMPTYLTENFGFDNSKSIFLTVLLAIFTMISYSAAGALHKKFFRNELTCATAVYAFSAVCALVLFALFDVGFAAISVLMMALITSGMHGVSLMLTSHIPKRFLKYGNVSTMSGLVNSFTYIGSAIATYGVARVSETQGWKPTVAVWLGILVLGALLCFLAIPKWKRFIEE